MLQNMMKHAAAFPLSNVKMAKSFVGVYLLCALVGFCASLLFCGSMRYLLLGYEKKRSAKVIKIICACLSILNSSLIITYICLSNYFFEAVDLEYVVSTRVNIGVVLSVVLVVALLATCFIRTKEKKQRVYEKIVRV